MQHVDTLDQRNTRTHVSYIALSTSLKYVVIGNGGSTFLCTPSWRVYNFDVHSPFLIIICLVHLRTISETRIAITIITNQHQQHDCEEDIMMLDIINIITQP